MNNHLLEIKDLEPGKRYWFLHIERSIPRYANVDSVIKSQAGYGARTDDDEYSFIGEGSVAAEFTPEGFLALAEIVKERARDLDCLKCAKPDFYDRASDDYLDF